MAELFQRIRDGPADERRNRTTLDRKTRLRLVFSYLPGECVAKGSMDGLSTVARALKLGGGSGPMRLGVEERPEQRLGCAAARLERRWGSYRGIPGREREAYSSSKDLSSGFLEVCGSPAPRRSGLGPPRTALVRSFGVGWVLWCDCLIWWSSTFHEGRRKDHSEEGQII